MKVILTITLLFCFSLLSFSGCTNKEVETQRQVEIQQQIEELRASNPDNIKDWSEEDRKEFEALFKEYLR